MFIGHLDDGHLKLLPRGLQQLYLVVAGSDHARSLLPALAKALSGLPSLQTIGECSLKGRGVVGGLVVLARLFLVSCSIAV